MNKIDELITVVQTYKPHIVAITETWLHEQINDTEITINNYHIFLKDREGRGGGQLLFIKSSLRPKQQIELKHACCGLFRGETICSRWQWSEISWVFYTSDGWLPEGNNWGQKKILPIKYGGFNTFWGDFWLFFLKVLKSSTVCLELHFTSNIWILEQFSFILLKDRRTSYPYNRRGWCDGWSRSLYSVFAGYGYGGQ